MSQFMFGEIVSSSGNNVPTEGITLSGSFPFSLRFNMRSDDYYCRIAPAMYSVTPFVVTDSPVDNTAELLLRSDICRNEVDKLPASYSELLHMPLQDRIESLIAAIKQILSKTGSECILVLCDGADVQMDCEECSISELRTKLMGLLLANQLFYVATYWIKP